MSNEKKTTAVVKINNLLAQFDRSVSKDDTAVKVAIQATYNQINKPEKDAQKYKQIPEAVQKLTRELQDMAVAKQYHFSTEQNKILNELQALSRGSLLDGSIGIINGAVFH
ncbi:hypothetical protein ACFQAV_00320 [Companilactobacillus huachuanensis]|uniref:Bacteriocin immunity protein n=1 Tax=Companilactobacillus huachuanensis TaxID=2559914 RepID=A0ABW1RKW9_9LACO|nr:hypothetical protein [Companilactobacillus huachuanensis]